MVIHNKLVRDKIPQIIQKAKKKPVTKTLNQEEFIVELRKKSKEELQEYLSAQTNEEAIEELADILEIIHSLAKVHHSTFKEIESRRIQKLEQRGGFDERIFLIKVDD